MPMQTARRTHGFRESVIRGMTRLAREHHSLNLAQGFPNFPAPDVLKEAAVRAVRDDINQYAITWGAQHLREALARTYQARYGLVCDPEREITVTCGATEAMIATLLAVVNPGDEVIVFEPFYEKVVALDNNHLQLSTCGSTISVGESATTGAGLRSYNRWNLPHGPSLAISLTRLGIHPRDLGETHLEIDPKNRHGE